MFDKREGFAIIKLKCGITRSHFLKKLLCLLARLSLSYEENLWLNSGDISRAMFARALKEIRNNDVFGYNFGHARWPIY